MSILVTGAAGFIGSNLTEGLIKENRSVVALDIIDDYYDPAIKEHNIAFIKDTVPFYKVDINDTEKLFKIIQNEKIDKIVHFAARPGVRPSLTNPELYNKMNTLGTINLLKLSVEFDIKQFVFSSTSSIYGGNEKTPFSESDHVDNQISPYAVSKRAAELYCNNYAKLYGLPVTCLRLFTVYGPRQRPEMAIHKFTREIFNGEELPMFGDGSSSRDYTYVDDIVDGFVAALDNPFAFEIINLGDASPVKLSKLISLVEKATGKKANIKQMSEQLGDMKITFADISKAKKMLGYSPKIPLEEGVVRFVEWYKETFEVS